MDLARAFNVKAGQSLAFVGAGGKTSAMFALAHALKARVILTTTTHLGVWQAELAEKHHVIQNFQDIAALDLSSADIHLITGPRGSDDRLSALKGDLLEALRERSSKDGIPLLIEADGARQRPLKAPAEYEPVIPAWIDRVVVVAGLAGVGEPLTDVVVHRPDRFAAITGRTLGAKIQVEDLLCVLGSAQGGLKGIPESAQRVLFLNQADDLRMMALGGRIARQLLGQYHQIMVASLQQEGIQGPVFSVHSKTAGVVLAAGGSERLGAPKQLLSWQGKPFIRKVVENGLEAGLSPLVVVTGAAQEAVAIAVDGLPVILVHNDEWETGQASSMRAGLSALSSEVDSALFLLSDQPQISVNLISQLIERYAQNRIPITAPLVDGQHSNPVLFAQETFEALMKVSGDRGGRAVFNQFSVDWLTWVDRRSGLDVDKLGDEGRLMDAYFPDRSPE